MLALGVLGLAACVGAMLAFFFGASFAAKCILSGLSCGLSIGLLCEAAFGRSLRRQVLASLALILFSFFFAMAGLTRENLEQRVYLVAILGLGFQLRYWLLALARVRRNEQIAFAREISSRAVKEASVFVDNDIESLVPTETLREGHICRVPPQGVFPADGVVTFGSGFVAESFSDSSDTKLKGMGSPVFAGTRSENGTLLVRVTSTGMGTYASRMARALGYHPSMRWFWAVDGAALLVALILFAVSGPAAAVPALLTSSAASVFAVLTALHFSLARVAVTRLWLWGEGGLARLARAGMLVTTAPGVLSEGRPKLAAVETLKPLSEDAALGLLGPLARKLESPAAYALLLELRARNIPLQLADFFEPREDGGLCMIGGEEIRWVTVNPSRSSPAALGELGPFVAEHINAGDEVCLLERQGTVQAALAFRDATVKDAPHASEELRRSGYPVLLVSPLPKRCTARLQTELGLEHAQGESGPREIEMLVARLADEKLSPAWLQAGSQRPARAAAVLASAAAASAADLLVPDIRLPEVAHALRFGKLTRYRTRAALGLLFGAQAGLLLSFVTANPVIAATLHLGSGWTVNPLTAAILGVLPGFLAFFLAHTRLDADLV
jgi:cation transport ATPase